MNHTNNSHGHHHHDEEAHLRRSSLLQELTKVVKKQLHMGGTAEIESGGVVSSEPSPTGALSGGAGGSAVPPPPPPRTHVDSGGKAPPPISRGLPLHRQQQQQQQSEDIRLIHPILKRVPLQFRFGFNGLLSNVLFMVVYNRAVSNIHTMSPSTIYSIWYFFFIPLSHAMVSLLVFGWPERYVPSLMSNFPIGLTAMAIGAALTAYLDKIDFNEWIEEYVRNNLRFSHMPPRSARSEQEGEQEPGEFYTSLAVLVVTSIWTYVLSVYINSPPAKSDKKEL